MKTYNITNVCSDPQYPYTLTSEDKLTSTIHGQFKTATEAFSKLPVGVECSVFITRLGDGIRRPNALDALAPLNPSQVNSR